MIKGLYAAVSAMIAGINKQALKTHNIANMNTPGFKQVFTTLQEFKKTDVTLTSSVSGNPDQTSIGMLGLGVMTTETRIKFGNGALQATNQPLDFAIQGNGFFRIKTPEGERYTRDGRFIRDANENLVTVDGNWVLDSSGNPIRIPDGDLSVTSGGNIMINGTLNTQLGMAEFSLPDTQLQKDTGNLFKALEEPVQSQGNSTVHQGYLEMPNVNVIDMFIGSKTYEAAQRLVQIQDDLLGKSISTLGKMG